VSYKIRVKLWHPNSKMPQLPKKGDACFDISSVESVRIMPHTVVAVSTGLSFEPPYDVWLQLESRSGLACKGIIVVGGIIDQGYRGEVKVPLLNATNIYYDVNAGDRIAQVAIRRMPFEGILYDGFEQVEELSETERGDRGFGSSGS
jgi:dUTP pyrophosphatase